MCHDGICHRFRSTRGKLRCFTKKRWRWFLPLIFLKLVGENFEAPSNSPIAGKALKVTFKIETDSKIIEKEGSIPNIESYCFRAPQAKRPCFSKLGVRYCFFFTQAHSTSIQLVDSWGGRWCSQLRSKSPGCPRRPWRSRPTMPKTIQGQTLQGRTYLWLGPLGEAEQRWPVAHVERPQETCSMLSLLEDFVATTQQSKIDLQARSGVPTTAKDPNCKGTKPIWECMRRSCTLFLCTPIAWFPLRFKPLLIQNFWGLKSMMDFFGINFLLTKPVDASEIWEVNLTRCENFS